MKKVQRDRYGNFQNPEAGYRGAAAQAKTARAVDTATGLSR
ncbi:hypothetical protein ACKWRH_06995 [Bradyrhizobium sp. Pa8]